MRPNLVSDAAKGPIVFDDDELRDDRVSDEVLWRRWTGIEPAGWGSPIPTALKAAEPTRYPDTSR